MLRKFYLRLLGYREYKPFRHPLADRTAKPGRDPLEVERRKTKQAVLQAHIDAARERRDAETEWKQELAAKKTERRLNSMIEEFEMVVDRRGYEAGIW